jgi:hypothetical protein
MTADLVEAYVAYRQETEPPYVFHRWGIISSIGALLGRNYLVQFGDFRVFPNLYCMFIGDAGSRKSTAIKQVRRLVSRSGYDYFAADKSSKEQFLVDLEGASLDDVEPGQNTPKEQTYDKIMSTNLWGDQAFTEPREVFVVADEWNEFGGTANLEFYTTLGNLWDWDDETKPFKQRFKNSKKVAIWQPTVSILSGNTHENFQRAFPPEAIGQGFLSRMLLIYGERSGRKYTFPPVPEEDATTAIVESLQAIRGATHGIASVGRSAEKMLDTIYTSWQDLDDIRFKSYSNRRFTQLLKICLILSAARGIREFTDEIIITANTYLTAAERLMPKALGEFGKSKVSDVANKMMDALLAATKPLTAKDLWKIVYKDLEKPQQMSEILNNMQSAERIQYVKDRGYLPKRTVAKEVQFVDFKLLTEEERMML